MGLGPRQRKLILYLLEKTGWVKGKEIAVVLGVSERTVRSDVKFINSLVKDGELIVSSKKDGYFLKDLAKAEELIRMSESESSGYPEERAGVILKKLLFSKDGIDVLDLAEELNVSEATCINDIKALECLLKESGWNLELERRSTKIILNGPEKEKRNLMMDLILGEAKEGIFNIKEYEKYFKKADVEEISKVLVYVLKERGYNIGDLGLLNLLLYISVTVERIKEGYFIEELNFSREAIKGEEFVIASEICRKIEERQRVKFPEDEVFYISHLISGFKKEEKSPSRDTLRNLADSYYLILTEVVLERINMEFGFNFREDDILVVGLCMHIKMVRERAKKGARIKNCFVEEIKRRYPMIFEISVFFAREFSRFSGLNIDEDEIGFLAFHFGAAFERLFQREKKKKIVAVVCPAGHTASKILISKLEKYYKDQLEIIGAYSFTELDLLKENSPDYIISTVPIELDYPAKVIRISPFFDERDREAFEKILAVENKKALRCGTWAILGMFIKKELFFSGLTFGDEKEVIDFLAFKLYEKGYVPENYAERVMEREKLSPTSFGNLVAIPHSVTMDAYGTAVAVGILKKPVMWGKNKVQLIFMFAIKKEERKLLDTFFEQLIPILDNPAKIARLIKSTSFEEFKENLVEFCAGEI